MKHEPQVPGQFSNFESREQFEPAHVALSSCMPLHVPKRNDGTFVGALLGVSEGSAVGELVGCNVGLAVGP